MTSQRTKSKTHYVNEEAWELIQEVLRPSSSPSPAREYWELVAEQERLMVLDILKHRLTVL